MPGHPHYLLVNPGFLHSFKSLRTCLKSLVLPYTSDATRYLSSKLKLVAFISLSNSKAAPHGNFLLQLPNVHLLIAATDTRKLTIMTELHIIDPVLVIAQHLHYLHILQTNNGNVIGAPVLAQGQVILIGREGKCTAIGFRISLMLPNNFPIPVKNPERYCPPGNKRNSF